MFSVSDAWAETFGGVFCHDDKSRKTNRTDAGLHSLQPGCCGATTAGEEDSWKHKLVSEIDEILALAPKGEEADAGPLRMRGRHAQLAVNSEDGGYESEDSNSLSRSFLTAEDEHSEGALSDLDDADLEELGHYSTTYIMPRFNQASPLLAPSKHAANLEDVLLEAQTPLSYSVYQSNAISTVRASPVTTGSTSAVDNTRKCPSVKHSPLREGEKPPTRDAKVTPQAANVQPVAPGEGGLSKDGSSADLDQVAPARSNPMDSPSFDLRKPARCA